ncbi:MAG: tape measure protein, partial [Gallionellaceae bacterium]
MNTLKFATGDAASEFKFLQDTSARLGTNLQGTAGSYAKLAAAMKGSSLEGQGARDVFSATMTASSALGLSAEDTSGMLKAFEQMVSKGNVQAEELRGQLGERLPNAFGMAAKAMKVTTQQLNKMLEQGEVLATDLLPKLAAEIEATMGQAAQDAAASTRAELNKLDNAWFELGVSISQSGVQGVFIEMVKIAADALQSVEDVINRINGNTTSLKIVNDAIVDINVEIDNLNTKAFELRNNSGFFDPRMVSGLKGMNYEIKNLYDRLGVLEKTKARLRKEEELSGGGKGDKDVEGLKFQKETSAMMKHFSKMDSAAKQFGKDSREREQARFETQMFDLNKSWTRLEELGAKGNDAEKRAAEEQIKELGILERTLTAANERKLAEIDGKDSKKEANRAASFMRGLEGYQKYYDDIFAMAKQSG